MVILKSLTLTGNQSQRDYYVNGTLQNTSYVVTSQSDLDSILNNSPNTSFEYQYNQSSFNVVELRSYTASVLIDKRINVLNAAGGLVCSSFYQLLNGILTMVSTEKYYYDINNEDKYYFIYNADGSCFHISDLQVDDADFYAWSIGVDPDVTFTWSGFEYYQNANPLIPN